MERRVALINAFKGNDDLGVVIRSHIIIEQYLNDIIESVLAKPEIYRKNINLDYHVKVKVVTLQNKTQTIFTRHLMRKEKKRFSNCF